MRDKLLSSALVLLAACALVSTGFTVWRSMREPSVGSAEQHPVWESDWARFASAGHVLGPKEAQVTIVEFGDFECPFCRILKASLDTLQFRHPGEIKLVFRHFPLRGHRFAIPASRASECADEQGRFRAMYNALYDNQDSLGLQPWSWFASVAQVPDLKKFDRCVAQTKSFRALEVDTAAGRQLRIRGTPTILVNGLRISGAASVESLEVYIERAKPGFEAKRQLVIRHSVEP